MSFQITDRKDVIQQMVRSMPTEYVLESKGVQGKCCALHKPVAVDEGGVTGCRLSEVGYHRSLRDLYQLGDVTCHAEVGQLVLDKALFGAVVDMRDAFFFGAAGRSKTFVRRYMQGNPVDVQCYGKGYCYLAVIDPAARSRVARCLGPLPLLADVFRFYVACGISQDVGVCLRYVGEKLWHAERLEDGIHFGGGYVFAQMCSILAVDSDARIGVEKPSDFKRGEISVNTVDGARVSVSFGEIRKSLCSVPSFGMEHDRVSVSAHMESDGGSVDQPYRHVRFEVGEKSLSDVFGGDHMRGLCDWFEIYGVTVSGSLANDLALAITARSVIPENAACLRDVVKTWAVLGDAVLKVQAAQYCVAVCASADGFSALSKRTTNSALAGLLVATGLRAHCKVGLLSESSKGNADMFEAIVGVLSLHIQAHGIRKFLERVGVVPVIDDRVRTIKLAEGFGGTCATVGLNSQQVETVAKLFGAKLL